MIEPDRRSAIYQLHLAGTPQGEIARQFHVSDRTVRTIIRQQGAVPQTVRKDKIEIDADLLRRLYQQCGGWVQRVHEKLVEEEGIEVSYSTLTRLVRELELGKVRNARCDRVPDEPGVEMQHDTSVYKVKLSGKPTRVIASLLYLRYSKRRYLKFYRAFNRFAMKCFFHEALMFWGYSARQCVIDNTNLARLRGSGRLAVIVPEMAVFAGRYGFHFICHEIRHPNRKAGEERSFRTVETSFLPGRSFENLEDLNRQAFEWATVRMEHRPASKTRLIPAKAFEHECSYLTRLSAHLPAPYLSVKRDTDKYGYIPFEGNHYWIPGSRLETVKVLRYADRLKIYRQRTCIVEYPLPADGVKNARISPEGQPPPRYQPRHGKHGSRQEEQRLRALGPEAAAYVDYALQTLGVQRHRFLRELFALSRQVTPAVFVETVARALRYRVVQLETLRRIAWLCMSQGQQPLSYVDVDESFRQRPAYQEGFLTDEPDLSVYDETLGQDDAIDKPESEDHDG
ncbi:MAG: helix-turn-helix domain-containing protein [Candidatus Krumholzibacteria bacterium]|nr:helix-turn-helix domain-containing protein [Candidatus Krumholzibacteria bacterium]